MKIFNYNIHGIFCGISNADKDPETGGFLIPAMATTIEPPIPNDNQLVVYEGDNWSIIAKPEQTEELEQPTPPTVEELRTRMALSNAQARIKMVQLGIFDKVNDTIVSMSHNEPIYILWEYSATFHRNNEYLVDFCKNSLHMSDEDIDNLFT